MDAGALKYSAAGADIKKNSWPDLSPRAWGGKVNLRPEWMRAQVEAMGNVAGRRLAAGAKPKRLCYSGWRVIL